MNVDELIGEAQRLPVPDQLAIIKRLGEGLPKGSLRSAVGLLRGLQPDSGAQKSDVRAEEAFYDAVAQHLRRMFNGKPPPFQIFRRGQGGTAVREAASYVDEFLDEGFSNLRLADRLHFYQLYARLMAGYLCEVGAPVALRSMFNTHQHFPALMDREFPGYLGDPSGRKILLSVLRRPSPPPETG